MRVAEFDFDLPESLIAQVPLAERGASRLLCMDRVSGTCVERTFGDLTQLLRPGDCVVLNDTRVIKARLFALKSTGGRVEVLLERIESEAVALAWLRASKPVKTASRFRVGEVDIEVMGVETVYQPPSLYRLRFSSPVAQVLETYGHVPLPPYIRRADDRQDEERYQTVYAKVGGAVAAPTAGLHFDEELLEQLRLMGVETVFVTLHVGAGTFQPVRTEQVEKHRLHSEYASIGSAACESVRACKHRGGRVVAVGTTCVRSLESAARTGELRAFSGDTELFIYPGYQCQVVDAIVTNFHLPRSSLLMLVCAFAGTGNVLAAYRRAVRDGFRFYSYGDAMFLAPDINAL